MPGGQWYNVVVHASVALHRGGTDRATHESSSTAGVKETGDDYRDRTATGMSEELKEVPTH
jgi:hypothetical protein